MKNELIINCAIGAKHWLEANRGLYIGIVPLSMRSQELLVVNFCRGYLVAAKGLKIDCLALENWINTDIQADPLTAIETILDAESIRDTQDGIYQ